MTSQPITEEFIREQIRKMEVRTIRLQFTDILGTLKNIEIPISQLDRIFNGQIQFDGSSIKGFVRIEESDMYLIPDLSTFRIIPWSPEHFMEARMICDIQTTDRKPFLGDPRNFLRRMIEEAKKEGFEMMVGPEAEFFLFEKDKEGHPTVKANDYGGYFDMMPTDLGEECRRDIMTVLELMDFELEASHHEAARGQHEIDFRYDEALSAADNINTFKLAVKSVAIDHNLHATFMPKPIHGIPGSGMHCNLSFMKDGKNAFFDEKAPLQLSQTALYFIGGLLKHAKALTALANPTVNSYKRLVPGYEAPVFITWAEQNRSPMIRIPASRGMSTRVEVRSPDPSCNPYLTLGALLFAGLDGIKNQIDPGDPVNKNLYEISLEECEEAGIQTLPETLGEAVRALEEDKELCEALGEHISKNFIKAKTTEWEEYIQQVHQWELDRYLARY